MQKIKKRSLKWIFWLLVLAAAVLGAAAFALSVGSAGIPFGKVFRILFEGQKGIERSIIWDIRMPRLLLGFAIGGALSLAGVILQGMFRNPLVEPYTLGISGGAAVGVSLNILFGLHRIGVLTMPFSGFLGACLVILLLYGLNMKRRVLSLQGLLLTGVMINFIASSLIMLILALSRRESLQGIIFWIMGSLDEPNAFLTRLALGASVLFLVATYFFHSDLNALALGEEEALHLGVPVERTKRLLFLITSLLIGVSVAVSGMIGFVGLVVPHFMKKMVGCDHRILLAASFLAGGAFLVFCDTLARTVIAPMELPVGVITGILGGSLFVFVLMRDNGEGR
ncbi:MAG TPA: iron ABC transporter permease [Candidatus Omnitrophota bacterium]|nr:iron ABC transporter permease [Candidatus Omnitrophota bacterium]HPS37557.1 iron ABC transporter permease [Candidatus Omnitrophota bacterium]